MDRPQYSKLMAVLARVPDPRQARGKQLEWDFLWGVIASAMLPPARRHRHRALGSRQATTVLAAFRPHRARAQRSDPPPGAAAGRCGALERRLAAVGSQPVPAPPRRPTPQGHAIDGKHLRGAGHTDSRRCWSACRPQDAAVLAQTAVAHKRHESQAVPAFVGQPRLAGDGHHDGCGPTQPKIATQIRAQGGHYLMVVKRNRRQLYDELTWFFATPPVPCDRPWRTVTTVNKGHGRLETRT